MDIRPAILTLRPLAALLILFSLLLATVVDAATCGTEIAPTGAIESMAVVGQLKTPTDEEDRGDAGALVDQHGVCAHGHCHHGANFAEAVRSDQRARPATIIEPTNVVVLSSATNNRLKRPPRA